MLCNAKRVSSALTSLVAVIAFSSYFGTASRVKATEVSHPTHQHDQGDWLVPTGKGWGRSVSGYAKGGKGGGGGGGGGHGPGGGGTKDNGIQYHGGPVILGTAHLYYIWYGNWDFSVNPTDKILQDFGNSIGGTHYFGINKTYYDSTNTLVSGDVAFTDLGKWPADQKYGGTDGTSIDDNAVQSIVEDVLKSKNATVDKNGVYFVLTSKDVNETTGFCTLYCAWHGYGTTSTNDNIRLGFIGNPERCPTSCSAAAVAGTTPPNQDAAADGMANLIGHELAEAVTDPDISAWYDRRGRENADKCAWKFGALNGSNWNVNFGNSRNWLLQQNWINTGGGYCTLTD